MNEKFFLLFNVCEELDISVNTKTTLINNNILKSLKKIKGRWFISEEDYLFLKREKEYIRNSYTVSEARIILNFPKNRIYDRFNVDMKECYGPTGKVNYIPKKIINDYKNKLEELANNGYKNLKELKKIYNYVDYTYLYCKAKTGEVKTIKFDIDVYYLLSNVDKVFNDLNFSKNAYEIDDLNEMFGVVNRRCFYAILFSKYFDVRVVSQRYYFDKKLVNQYFDNLKNNRNVPFQIIHNGKRHRILEGNEIEKYYESIGLKKIAENKENERENETNLNNTEVYYDNKGKIKNLIVDSERYIDITTASNLAKLKKSTIDVTYTKLDNNLLYKGRKYIQEKELMEIILFYRKNISFSEIRQALFEFIDKKSVNGTKKILLHPENLMKKISQYEFVLWNKIGVRQYYVISKNKEADLKKIVEEIYYSINLSLEKDGFKRYKLLIENIEKQFLNIQFTVNTYSEMVEKKLYNSSTKKITDLAHQLFNTINKLVCILEKDFVELDDKELTELLQYDNLISTDRLNISLYISYLKENYLNRCNFKGSYTRYVQIKERSTDDIYTKDEWANYLSYLINIDIHIEKAFSNFIYSRTWLYTLLHFSISWRRSDILNICKLDILDIEKYDIYWFKTNEFRLSDAQYIINNAKKSIEQKYTLKTGASIHFTIPMQLIIPTAIAIISTEKLRRVNNFVKLFNTQNLDKSNFSYVFDKNLEGFQSIKANRTLITYCNSTATQMKGFSEISYSLNTYARSHIIQNSGISETTAQYIYATNKDGEIYNISKQLFNRGIFGWIYQTILDLVYTDKFDNFDEMTIAIQIVKESIPINAIENLSSYIDNEALSRKEIIDELLNCTKTELVELIEKIFVGDLTSKENDTQCIKYKKCPFPTVNKCFSCKYCIPSNYTLIAINEEIKELLDKLIQTEEKDYLYRQKYTYQIVRLLTVLKEAKNHFDKLDKDYIKKVLDLDEIESKLDKVKATKFLMRKEE